MDSGKSKFIRYCKDKNYSEKDIDFLSKALDFSFNNLSSEKRICGETAFDHNINVARILVDNVYFPEVVVSGILYGAEKVSSYQKIEYEFGKEVADIVFGQESLRETKKKSERSESDIVRRILLAGISDVRIIFVKLADKLDNLRTLGSLPREKRTKVAKEVLAIYAPLAGRLGLEKVKRDLENLSFKALKPRKYREIENFLKDYKYHHENIIQRCISEFSGLLGITGIKFSIKGREKSIYSIYKKITDRKVPLGKQRDFFGVRIIVEKEEECYAVLGILFEHYLPVEKTFKDYIANPKPSGYQALHTILNFHDEQVEVQIKTQEMHEAAEEGVSAHWSYKKMKSSPEFEKKVGWLKSVLNLQLNEKEKDSLRDIRLDIFDKGIFCYTPKGDMINLPVGSTILDFAYAIHGAVGNSAVAGRINGKFSALRQEIKNGDIIEIITNKNQKPRREWMKFVVSSKARDAIRKTIQRNESIPVPRKISVKKEDHDAFDSMVHSGSLPGYEFTFAGCCSPNLEDNLVGIEKSYKRAVVHRSDCKKIDSSVRNIFPVYWKDSFEFPIMINVECKDRSGILAEILNILASEGFIIRETKAKLTPEEIAKCSFIVFPKNREYLKKVIERIKKINGFRKLYFGEN